MHSVVKTATLSAVIAGSVILPVKAQNRQCSDFSYSHEAQQYMRTYNARYLDTDSDGLACDSLPTTPEYGDVTREKWDEIYSLSYSRNSRLRGGNQAPLTLYEIQSIMGFSGGKLYGRNGAEKWVWRDLRNPSKKIEILFLNREVKQLTKSGF